MKKFFIIPFIVFTLAAAQSCSPDDNPAPDTDQPATPERPDAPENPEHKRQ